MAGDQEPRNRRAGDESNSNAEVFRRVSQLEKGLSSLETSMTHMVTAMGDLRADLHDLVGKVGSRSQTNWATLAAWASVIVAIMVFYSNSILDPVKVAQELHQKSHQYENTIELLRLDVANVKIDAVKERLLVVESWQRENNVRNTSEVSALKEAVKRINDDVILNTEELRRRAKVVYSVEAANEL